jgi:mannose-1-phosphate guanylyltransferase/phosphomannomutase
MKAVVLAAGVGSRLDPLTTQMPKPMVPVANRPVMEHILNLLKRHGVKQVYSNLHHLPEKLVEYFGDGSRLGFNIHFYTEPVLTGDAGGVRAMKQNLMDDTFIVLMGDLMTDADIASIVAAHRKKGALATIGLKRVDDVTQFGVAMLNKEGFITGFQEKPAQHEALSDLASTGIYVLEPEVFKHIPDEGTYGFGRQLFPSLLQKGLPVLGYEIHGYWSDVGTIKQYKQANFDALDGTIALDIDGRKTAYGWMGEGSSIAPDCKIKGTLLLGKNSRIAGGVTINGRVVIGDNCVIEEGAVLEDTVIWSDCHVEPNAKVKNCVIGCNCVVNGSHALLEATMV